MFVESWLTIKDSLTHHPSSQGWASSDLHVCCFIVLVIIMLLDFCLNRLG